MSGPASIEFLAWMAATTGVYWLSPAVLRRYVLVLSTAAVLIYADPKSLLALSAMTAAVCIAARIEGAWKNASLLVACAAILGTLLAFKLLESFSADPSLLDRAVPLGLSYYSLRCIHLLLERYLGQIQRPGMLQTVEYLFFPPTIIAGPIHRYPVFASEAAAKIDPNMVSEALERILYGYVKIVVLSNFVLGAVIFPRAMAGLEPSTAAFQYLDCLNYGLTLYLQFSGYSDIVIGFALLLGHRVMENFSWPLLKPDIVAFWRSWHISLTSLCREYVFTSVYAGTRQAWFGVFATMLAISLWHGLTLNYLAWGLYHGAGVVIFQRWSDSTAATILREKLPLPISRFLGWFLTFQFVMLGFVWTKEKGLSAAIDAYTTLIMGTLGRV